MAAQRAAGFTIDGCGSGRELAITTGRLNTPPTKMSAIGSGNN
jgi:hypothetical protein